MTATPNAPRTRIGACACGKLSIACDGEPLKVSLCHCFACQRRTGGPYGVAAFFSSGDVRPAGPAQAFRRIADSGFAVTSHFCPRCGATVYWEPERKPGQVAVAIGAFADPTFPAPTQAVRDDRRHPWATPRL